ncbi:TRAP transporter small permease [Desulfosediminicola flagellatus]|uniref:TRAP transporter small permease n=1 Tax=Desulfosediminicola flagellatus TaxID=2569541 RepID=UPI0010AD81F3|nr:TRAP transporter small permease [Desulfosediminicola flagellatus]
MKLQSLFKKLFNNIESYICRLLLVMFVTLLFVQIILRGVFGYSVSWIEELSTYMFVWFAYFGASHAAKMSAHNRVTFQFKPFPKIVATICEFIADMIWVAFNLYFVYLSYDFVFNKMNLFWKSQTLGVPMKYFYVVLPIAFALMTVRVLQVNYLKLFKGVDIRDPDSCELEGTMEIMADDKPSAPIGNNK